MSFYAVLLVFSVPYTIAGFVWTLWANRTIRSQGARLAKLEYDHVLTRWSTDRLADAYREDEDSSRRTVRAMRASSCGHVVEQSNEQSREQSSGGYDA